MNKEGQTAEQPVAPAPVAASPATPAETPAPAVNQQPTTNTTGPVTTGPAPAEPRNKNNRLVVIVIAIAAAALIIGGIVALVINTNNNNTSTTVGGSNTSATEVKEEADQLKDDSGIDAMLEYMNNIFAAYNNGTGYQNLTKEEVGGLYTDYMLKLAQYVNQNQNQRDTYASTIVEYAHAADKLLGSAQSAEYVYFAEKYYGNKDVSEQYKNIAIERGSKNFESNPDGQG